MAWCGLTADRAMETGSVISNLVIRQRSRPVANILRQEFNKIRLCNYAMLWSTAVPCYCQVTQDVRSLTAVKITVVQTPPVVEVRIKRPDTKYQLGFSVQNGVICSLLRGGIAERGGIRVGHRIIEINGQSVVAVPHEKVVTMLATAVGEIQMKTMRTSMFRLLTGQETPHFL
ncbi:PDZ/DHR/GLGF domain protein [Trichuris suis]|nr:PDZ/DHR/GLGF domain protein [Trichuris suis]